MRIAQRVYASETTDHLMGHLAHRRIDQERELHNDKVRREADQKAPEADNQPKLPGGDRRALRGIPVEGFGGAMNGTRPDYYEID